MSIPTARTLTHSTDQADPARGPASTDRLERLIAQLANVLDAVVSRQPATAQPEPLAVDLARAAEMLSCSLKTVKRMAAAGELPGVVRIRRRIVVSVPALRDWMAKGCPPVVAKGRQERGRRRG